MQQLKEQILDKEIALEYNEARAQGKQSFVESMLDSVNPVGIDSFAVGAEAAEDDEIKEKSKEDQRLIDEHNERVRNSPEFKANIVYHNYINSCGKILTGSQKRNIRREILRNAKKGKYDKLFDAEFAQKVKERTQKDFEKLNK